MIGATGARGESFEIVTQLGAQETASGSALEEFLSALSVFAVRVSFVVNQLPRTSVRCSKALAVLMLS